MKTAILFLSVIFGIFELKAQQSSVDQEIISLSKNKWQWMADKNITKLDSLFHEQSMFVHMGGSWDKQRELEVIQTGSIWYKKATIHDVSVQIISGTAILLNRIDLLAVVAGREVTNPFMVTEVYIKKDGRWQLGSLSFSRLLTPSSS